MDLDRIEDAVAAIAAGELVVVVDDTDRENEGDLIMAAATSTPEKMGFMIRHTSGIICVPMTAERADRLNLPPMVANNLDPMRTAFTVSVDYKVGMTTGISAEERNNTARALANDNCQGSDFLRPGHIFPLIARAGGVLTRSGHTEAGVDLAQLAGVGSIAVLAEVVKDDGTLMRLPELVPFAREHGLKIISIEDLISYRIRRETFVECVREEETSVEGVPVRVRVYRTPFDAMQHVAMVFGDVSDRDGVPTRIHREQPALELMAQAQGEESWAKIATKAMADRGFGVIVLLRTPQVEELPDTPQVAPQGDEAEVHSSALARMQRWREVGLGAQILLDLGVRSISVLATHERAYVGLTGFGIAVSGTTLVKD
ncbi:3,4-dihydroxy-2-butanone-4-phosphate synthase [Consotaella salsifontis]|uniref:3,4-dihydroxy-2-butanone 4-phosphate synthase n=1 Tax=Consotaella salsifontis TaxID=1365950 RepID=A0A1T4MNX0_9HYPH|nr:3,4-dihydroxy-2-butanone-4-phosphate synthase [Consotaella salsifontis]SJZ68516.1 3,4-dihydroxy 2-butanone 4-phosphate synthase / GTP cyclohydrolase II [Consotaella salsifontis]